MGQLLFIQSNRKWHFGQEEWHFVTNPTNLSNHTDSKTGSDLTISPGRQHAYLQACKASVPSTPLPCPTGWVVWPQALSPWDSQGVVDGGTCCTVIITPTLACTHSHRKSQPKAVRTRMLKAFFVGLEDGWEANSASQRPKVESQHRQCGSQLLVTPVPGDLKLVSDLLGHQKCMWYTDLHTD